MDNTVHGEGGTRPERIIRIEFPQASSVQVADLPMSHTWGNTAYLRFRVAKNSQGPTRHPMSLDVKVPFISFLELRKHAGEVEMLHVGSGIEDKPV